MDKLREILAKIPIIPLLILWVGKLGYDYYSFTTDASSALVLKKADIQAVKMENTKLQDEIKKVNDFLKNLEATKVELRNSAQKLDSFKATISDQLDIAEF